MATIVQNGKRSPILIHVLLVSEIWNCVHSYSKSKLIASKAFVWYLKTSFPLKAKSAKKKKTSFLLKNWVREGLIITEYSIWMTLASPGLIRHLREKAWKWKGFMRGLFIKDHKYDEISLISFQIFKRKSNVCENGSSPPVYEIKRKRKEFEECWVKRK